MARIQLAKILLLISTVCSYSVLAKKPFPYGVYESGGPIHHANDDAVSRTVNIVGQEGVLLRVAWDLCGDDTECLFDTIALNLETAENLGLKVALAVSDGHNIPPSIKNSCQLFGYDFMGNSLSFCLPWDINYLNAKVAFVNALGQRFDSNPALSYVYFTGSCTTNGYEGHCRVDENAFINAGYTVMVLSNAYETIMQSYVDSFAQTPIVFEAHTLFDESTVWDNIWNSFELTNKVGIANWWCSERLSLNGHDTLPLWGLVQEIASKTFSVCQTVANFSNQPWRFSDLNLMPALDYGTESNWDSTDVIQSFNETIMWLSGLMVHVDQVSTIQAYNTVEIWTQDMSNNIFANQLEGLLDFQNQQIFIDGFE